MEVDPEMEKPPSSDSLIFSRSIHGEAEAIWEILLYVGLYV